MLETILEEKLSWTPYLDAVARGVAIRLELPCNTAAVIGSTVAVAKILAIPQDVIEEWVSQHAS